jgi:hypothetical protein
MEEVRCAVCGKVLRGAAIFGDPRRPLCWEHYSAGCDDPEIFYQHAGHCPPDIADPLPPSRYQKELISTVQPA